MSILADRPLGGKRGVEVARANVEIVVRERGKKLPQHCRSDHNIWVTLGREYLAQVTAGDATFTEHYGEAAGTRRFVQYMGLGIGGIYQTNPAAYMAPLSTDYPPADLSGVPGLDGNKFTGSDLSVATLERPVALAEVAAGPPAVLRWLAEVGSVSFPIPTTQKVTRAFAAAELNTIGATVYPIVPVSESGLFLSYRGPGSALHECEWGLVYDMGMPGCIAVTRHPLVAYNPFEPIPVTVTFELELRWELRYA